MNKAFFLQLVFNASLLLTLALVYDLVAVRWRVGRASWRQVPVGILIGAVGVILMLASWQMAPGIVFDTRSILIGATGLFFGTVPTLVAMAVTGAYRLVLGGTAAGMGIAVILASGAVGLIWRLRRRQCLADMTWRELLLFGLSVHLVMLACTAFLPAAIRGRVLADIYLPVLLVYPAVSAVLGKLMSGHLKRELTGQSLRESEVRYQTLANVSPVGIFRTDAAGRTTYVNPMWSRISGLDAAAALGDGWLDAVHPDDRGRLSADWRDSWSGRRESRSDYRFLRPDGAIVWVMGQATPETNAGGEIVGYVGTITDISERKRAEELIRNSLSEKEILLKEVHHRVKNNLMTIIGLIKMQETASGNSGIHAMLLELESRIRSMALVHEGLYKSGNLARINLQDYIENLAAHIHAQFKSRSDIRLRVQAVDINVDLDMAVPCGLILNELITNAFKHAFPVRRGGADDAAEIRIGVEHESGRLTLSVTDNGIGFSAGKDLETSRTLGLSLIRMLCQQLRGSLERSGDGGTTIRLRIPLPAK